MRRSGVLWTIAYLFLAVVVLFVSYVALSLYFNNPLPFAIPWIRPTPTPSQRAVFSATLENSTYIIQTDVKPVGPSLYSVRLVLAQPVVRQGDGIVGVGTIAEDPEKHPVNFSVSGFPEGIVFGYHSGEFHTVPQDVEMVPYASASSKLIPGMLVQLPINPEVAGGSEWKLITQRLNALAQKQWDVLSSFTVPAYGIEILRQ